MATLVALTDRQRIAMANPAHWDGKDGYRSDHPHVRQIMVVVEPGGEKLPIGTPGRLQAKSKHWQMSTILTVDMETPTPLWHGRVAFIDPAAPWDSSIGPAPYEREHWRDWQTEYAMMMLAQMMPRWGDERMKMDRRRYALHMRLPVTEMEKSMLIAAELGPVLH